MTHIHAWRPAPLLITRRAPPLSMRADTSGDGKTGQCDTSKETPKAVQIFDYHDLGANETYVAAYVAKYGPVVIGLDATSAWQSYKGGVLTQSCAEAQLDHAVVIVGYGACSRIEPRAPGLANGLTADSH